MQAFSGSPSTFSGAPAFSLPGDPGRASVQLRRVDSGMGRGAAVQPDGAFEMWGVNPGRYIARASTSARALASAPLEIVVGDSNVDDIRLALLPSSDISGRIQPDEDQAGADEAQRPRQVGLLESGGRSYMEHSAMINADGSFVLKQVPPGRYRPSLGGYGFYLKALRIGGAEVPGGVLDLTGGGAVADLTLVVRRSTGEISGTVRDEDGPVEGATLVLVGETTRTEISGAGGTYRLDRVAPGKYRLGVVDEGDFRTIVAGGLEAFQGALEEIEIGDGGKITKDLKQLREQ